jgi:hypothetical protein
MPLAKAALGKNHDRGNKSTSAYQLFAFGKHNVTLGSWHPFFFFKTCIPCTKLTNTTNCFLQ